MFLAYLADESPKSIASHLEDVLLTSQPDLVLMHFLLLPGCCCSFAIQHFFCVLNLISKVDDGLKSNEIRAKACVLTVCVEFFLPGL